MSITKRVMVVLSVLVATTILFFIVAPVIPLLPEVQKRAMSVLYSDELFAEDVASKIFRIIQSPVYYGFEDQEGVVRWLNKKSWVTADGGSRQILVEPDFLGDIGWPIIVSSVKITIVYGRDGSCSVHRYYVHPAFSKV